MKEKCIKISSLDDIVKEKVELNMKQFRQFLKNDQIFLLSKKDNKELIERMSKVTDKQNLDLYEHKNILTTDKATIYKNQMEKLKTTLNIEQDVYVSFKCNKCKRNVNMNTMFHRCALKCNFVHIGGLKCGGTRCKSGTSHKGFISNGILNSLPEHKQHQVEKIYQIVTDSTTTFNYIIRSNMDYKHVLANLMQIKFENKFIMFKKCDCEKNKIDVLNNINQIENDFSDSKTTLSFCGCSCIELILRNIENSKKHEDNSENNHEDNALIFIYIEKSNHKQSKGFKHLQNYRKNILENKKIFFIIDSDSSIHYKKYLTSNYCTQASI